jgi:hypothetical protein
MLKPLALGVALLVGAWTGLAGTGTRPAATPRAPASPLALASPFTPAAPSAPTSARAARAGTAARRATTVARRCRIFPASNAINQEIAHAPVDPRSAQYVDAIGAALHLHADFGANRAYGIPYAVVGPRQPKVPIAFTAYGSESDRGPYPIPPNAPVEGAGEEGDRHVLVLQEGTCKLYELYDAHRSGAGWRAASGAVFDLRSNALRPEGWTSADAAGLPIFPLLARYEDVRAGRIDHALRVTVPRTQAGYVHPATHYASSSTDPELPPMGLRLRLGARFDLAPFHGQALVILRALKRYGLIVADNGSSWYITGAPNAGWNEADLDQLKRVPGSAFEAVRSGPILRR